jgi:hypothetical protein
MKWWPFGASSGGVGNAEAGLYGKLPCSAEFLRIHCLRGSGAAYRGWIDRCVEFGGGLDACWNLLLRPESTSGWIVARIRPSADAGGRRRFPITVFLSNGLDGSVTSAGERAQAAGMIWRRLATLDERLDDATEDELESLLARATSAAADGGAEVRPPEAVAGPSSSSTTSRLTGMDDDLLARRLWWGVRRTRAGGGQASSPGTLLPLWPDEDVVSQSIRWIEWLQRQGVDPGIGDRLALAVPQGDPSLGLRVLARPVDRGDFDLWLGAEAAAMPARPDSPAFEGLLDRVRRSGLLHAGTAALDSIEVGAM